MTKTSSDSTMARQQVHAVMSEGGRWSKGKPRRWMRSSWQHSSVERTVGTVAPRRGARQQGWTVVTVKAWSGLWRRMPMTAAAHGGKGGQRLTLRHGVMVGAADDGCRRRGRAGESIVRGRERRGGPLISVLGGSSISQLEKKQKHNQPVFQKGL